MEDPQTVRQLARLIDNLDELCKQLGEHTVLLARISESLKEHDELLKQHDSRVKKEVVEPLQRIENSH